MKQRIRLLHVISSSEMGGAQAVLCDLVRALPTDTYEQHVIYFHYGPYVERLQKLGVPVYQIRGGVCTYDLLFWWRMVCLVRKLNPTIIHASLWSAGVVSRLVGRWLSMPVVTAVHALFAHHGNVRNVLDRLTTRNTDRFVAVSGDVRSSMVQWLPHQRVDVIPNGIDSDYIRTLQHDHQSYNIPGLLSHHFVIGSVGRFVTVKRYDLLLDLFATLSEKYTHIRLVLVGTGPLEQELRTHAIQLGIADKVFFVVGQSAVRIYPRMHCFVQTSLHEGLSIALLEAMASGLICITTSHDGNHELVENEVNGWVVKSDNLAQITEYLQQLVENPAPYHCIGLQAAATVAQKFSIQSMRQGYEASFAAVAEKQYIKNSF